MLEKLPQTILDSVTSIPLSPLPQVLVRFISLIDEEKASLSELAMLVAQDPAFSAQILTAASSPATGQDKPGPSLEQSLAALGIPLLRTIASCMAVQNANSQAMYERNLDYTGYWCHSLRVAALARSLASAVGYQDVEEVYLAGLLHDIGQLLLVGGLFECSDPHNGTSGSETGLADATKIINSIDQAVLGAGLIDSWHLSSFMADAVLFHQYPAVQIRSAGLLCKLVWSAHYLSGCGDDIEASNDLSPIILEVASILGVEQTAIAPLCEAARLWALERAVFFGVQVRTEEVVSPAHKYIYPYVTLPKRDGRDAFQQQLDALVRNQAVMQPIQQRMLSFAGETDLYASLGETARILFGLQRPVFLVPLHNRDSLVAADCTGQSPLLKRLEIPLDQWQSLPCLALQTQQPASSFALEGEMAPSLIDVQLARLLGSPGLLCIPMGSDGQHSGIMVFGLSREQFFRKQGLLDWMTSFGRLAAKSIDSYRLLQQRDQKLAADISRQFEQKARKVIHEAVNPLGIINNYLNIFADKIGDLADVQQELNILKEEIFRVERIVRRLNDLPEQSMPVETVNVNALIEGMLALYGESLFESRGIDIQKELTPGLPPVRADRDSLKQILLNIWKNSAAAMPAGGSFRIATAVTSHDLSGKNLEIRLSDSGPGIPPEIKARLFQPLASDRTPAGSGLGLSIVASLVERLGGQIICDSSPENGTTFTIRLVQAQKELA